MKRPLPELAIVLIVASFVVSAGKGPTFLISFHEEGAAEDGAKRVKAFEVQGETRHFKTSPTLTQSNITAYWPFRSQDGQTWGAVFSLDESGGKALQRMGAANRGQLLAAAVDRVPVDVLYIDAQPADSRIVIWKGLAPALFQRIDKEKKIKRLADPSPALAADRRPAAKKGAPPSSPAQLSEGPAVDAADPALLDAATADLPKPDPRPKKARSSTGNSSRQESSLPPLPAPALPEEPPFQPDPSFEKPKVVPLAPR